MNEFYIRTRAYVATSVSCRPVGPMRCQMRTRDPTQMSHVHVAYVCWPRPRRAPLGARAAPLLRSASGLSRPGLASRRAGCVSIWCSRDRISTRSADIGLRHDCEYFQVGTRNLRATDMHVCQVSLSQPKWGKVSPPPRIWIRRVESGTSRVLMTVPCGGSNHVKGGALWQT